MTFRVPYIPAKRTFGTLKGGYDAGDYITFKNNSVYCCKELCNKCSIDPTLLNNNLIKKMDLKGVNVLQTIYPIQDPVSNTTINPSSVFYLTYTIDPTGALFGNSPCGINNYPNFMGYDK